MRRSSLDPAPRPTGQRWDDLDSLRRRSRNLDRLGTFGMLSECGQRVAPVSAARTPAPFPVADSGRITHPLFLRAGNGAGMSHQEATWAYKLQIKDRTCKLVFAQLCDAWTSEKGCYPSVARLAERVVASTRTVQRILKRLEQQGLIKCQFRPGQLTQYEINFDWLPQTHDVTPDTVSPPTSEPCHPRQNGLSPPTPDVTLTHRTQLRELNKTPLPPMEDSHAEQTNGHDEPSMGLGLIPAETEKPDPGNGSDRCACDHAKDAWNETAERCGWPRVQRFTPPRSKALEARLKEIGGLPEWQKMLAKMEASPFFRERWTPGFDWILKPANLTKIIEGNYDPKAKESSSKGSDPWQQRLRGYKPGGFWNPMWGEPPESGRCAAPADLLAEWRQT